MYIASPKLNLFASESALQIQLFDTMAGITIFCPKYNMLFFALKYSDMIQHIVKLQTVARFIRSSPKIYKKLIR